MVPSQMSLDAARYYENTPQIIISIEPQAPLIGVRIESMCSSLHYSMFSLSIHLQSFIIVLCPGGMDMMTERSACSCLLLFPVVVSLSRSILSEMLRLERSTFVSGSGEGSKMKDLSEQLTNIFMLYVNYLLFCFSL